MARYLVTYDLRKQGRNYENLYKALGAWKAIKLLESVWLINSAAELVVIRDNLGQHLDSNDAVFVAALTGETGWHGNLLSTDQAVKTILAP